MKIPSLILATLLAVSSQAPAEPILASPEAVKNWRDKRFGMFIHWGPVSLKGTEIGWSRGAQVPIDEYDKLYQQFNPTKFNADEWVAIAKAAGMKYMVLTTKHHDGFCLWDTKQTDYNIMNTPFKRDALKELAEACKKGGIAFGAYYSTCDWYHPDFPLGSPGGKVKKPTSNMKAYDAFLQAQCKELIENYGPLLTLWFDVPQMYTHTYGIPMVNKLRELQPDIMINNRAYSTDGVRNGINHALPLMDYGTPEQKIGGFDLNRPWETCMTICKQWAWKPNDDMKSLKECIHSLVRTNGGDGNLLFNVGPMPNGEIEARQVDRLKEMGAWLAKNGDSVYGTRGGPWIPNNHIVSTRKGNKIYLHLLTKVNGPVSVPALPVAIQSAKLLSGQAIQTSLSDGFLSLNIPTESWDEINTVVELAIPGDAMDLAPIKLAARPSMPGAKASASVVFKDDPNYSAAKVLDGDLETRWATPEGTKQAWLQIDFGKETTFSGIHIEEALASPHSRVRKFEIQHKDGDSWKPFHKGEQLGAHFKASFPPVTTAAIRLAILEANQAPTISEIFLVP